VFIGSLFFFPSKVFFRIPKKDGRRRWCGEVVDVLLIQDDRQGATQGEKPRISCGELSQNLNDESRHENRRLISAAFCEASFLPPPAEKREKEGEKEIGKRDLAPGGSSL